MGRRFTWRHRDLCRRSLVPDQCECRSVLRHRADPGLGLSAAHLARHPRAAGNLPRAVSVNWQQKYVGLPFKDFGRDFGGVDCWGLVRLVLARECGVAVPTYGEISARDLIRVTSTIAHDADADPWLPVARQDVRPFDVVLMRG